MSRKEHIEGLLQQGLEPSFLEVCDESEGHNVPPGSASHFRVVIVSEAFSDHSEVARHRMVYKLLREEFSQGLHALALHTRTPAEWGREQEPPGSPACRGGSAQTSSA